MLLDEFENVLFVKRDVKPLQQLEIFLLERLTAVIPYRREQVPQAKDFASYRDREERLTE